MAASKLLVGAIDFGTTYSGWAFSFVHDYKSDPTKVSVKQWHSGSGTLVTEKTPTVVLIKPDGETLEAFGYDAENRFKELVENDEQEGYYYFRRFKMMLHKKMDEKFSRDITIEDEFGKSLSAMKVFSKAIEFLTDDMIIEVNKKLSGGISKSDVKWVLTVPAIWTDSAKQFMREASIEAGVETENLVIALEPEAASIFCRYLSVDRTVDENEVSISSFPPRTKYMVLDAGGGTIDITVHEVQIGDGLKEVHAASGGGWGGILVDEAFKNLLVELVGKRVYDKFVDDETDDWLDLWRTFEVKKKIIDPNKKTKTVMKLPISLVEMHKKLTHKSLAESISSSKYSEEIEFAGDKIKFQASLMHAVFNPSIRKTVQHIEELMKESPIRDIKAILMVGGFSDSPMLQGMMKSKFPKVTVIIPNDAVSTILKGAVIYGHKPAAITERVLKFTYGISHNVEFIEGVHPESKKAVKDGKVKCRGVFKKHIEKFQSVKFGQSLERIRYTSSKKSDTGIRFIIYASERQNPMYVDDGCTKIGQVNVNFKDRNGELDNKVWVSLTFGGTEIEVTAEGEKTGKITTASVDFFG